MHMKKIYLLLLLCLPFIVEAQTITQSDLPVIGTSFTLAKDSTYTGPIPSPSLGQTWDFSSLLNLTHDSIAFVDINTTPFVDKFLNSSLAGYHVAADNYNYFFSDTSGFYITGHANQSSYLNYNPQQLYIPVPFSFTSPSRNDSGRFTIDTTIGSVNYRYATSIKSLFKPDGTGTLTIPSGTYQNVLGIKDIEERYDSVYYDSMGVYVPMHDSSTYIVTFHYRYYTSGFQANYLMGIDADFNGNTIKSEYLVETAIPLTVPTITEDKNVYAYPNPAIKDINFKFISSNFGIVVYDNSGKEVLKSKQIDSKRLNVEMLKNGVYHFEINQNNKIQKGSFVIQH